MATGISRNMFGASPWSKSSSMGDIFSDLAPWFERGAEAFSRYQDQQIKEAEAEAQRARAAAAQASAQAASAEARVQAVTPPSMEIMGIPAGYVLLGAAGVGVLALLVVLAR